MTLLESDRARIFAQAVAYHRAGEWARAENSYRVLLHTTPQHREACYNLGVLLLSQGRPHDALPFLETVLRNDPTQAPHWVTYITALIEVGDFKAAIQWLGAAKKRGLDKEGVAKLETRLQQAENTPTPLPPPAILSAWKALEGYGYGFSQPIATGQLHLCTTIDFSCLPLYPAIHAVFEAFGPLPDGLVRPCNPATFGQWLLALGFHFQRAHHIPLIEPPKIVGLHETSSGLVLDFALPFLDAPLGYQAHDGLITLVNQIIMRGEGLEGAPVPPSLLAPLAPLGARLNAIGSHGINTDRMLRSAVKHGIPFLYLGTQTFVVGQGKKARWLNSSFTDATSHLGTQFARHKPEAAHILDFHGLPVARHYVVENEEQAVDAAQRIGYPVVVKAGDLDGGVGVYANLNSPELVRRCFARARTHTAKVMVEAFFRGRDYRLTIIEGVVVKAIERIPGGITGNGRDTVAKQVKAVAEDEDYRRRRQERRKALLDLDEEALELLNEQGMTPQSIPPAGIFVALRRRANVSTGGSTLPVALPTIHRDNQRLAQRAAAALRLDVAGIDLILPDIKKSWFETGGIVCEVNAQPQFGENNAPGLYRDFFERLLGGDGRIPIALFAFAQKPSPGFIDRLVAAFDAGAGQTGLVWQGLFSLDGHPISPVSRRTHVQVRSALSSTEVARLLVIMPLDELVENGVPAQGVDALILEVGSSEPEDFLRIRALFPRLSGHFRGPLHLALPETALPWKPAPIVTEDLHTEIITMGDEAAFSRILTDCHSLSFI